MQVVRAMGLEPDPNSKPAKPSRIEVLQAVRMAQPDPVSQLPMRLDNGVTVIRQAAPAPPPSLHRKMVVYIICIVIARSFGFIGNVTESAVIAISMNCF